MKQQQSDKERQQPASQQQDNDAKNTSPQHTGNEETPIHLTGNSTLQSPEEFEKDKNRKPGEDEQVISSADDHHTNSGSAAGTDRAGTAERKDYGEPRLNKGIEEQGGQKTYDV